MAHETCYFERKPMVRREKPDQRLASWRATTRAPDGDRCSCQPSYRAEVYDSRAGKKLRKTFPDSCGCQDLAWRRWRCPPQRHARKAHPATEALAQELVARARSEGALGSSARAAC